MHTKLQNWINEWMKAIKGLLYTVVCQHNGMRKKLFCMHVEILEYIKAAQPLHKSFN